MNNKISNLSAMVGAAFVASAALSPAASATDATFSATSLPAGYTLAHNDHGKSEGEAKCGAEKKAEEEHKCGEGKCGEGKCGEGKCAGYKKAEGEHKCGEGKCGAGKKEDDKKAPQKAE